MGIPAFVREFQRLIIGTRVCKLGFVDAFRGIIVDAKIFGKRIQYEVLEDGGNRRLVFADDPALSHIQQDRITVAG